LPFSCDRLNAGPSIFPFPFGVKTGAVSYSRVWHPPWIDPILSFLCPPLEDFFIFTCFVKRTLCRNRLFLAPAFLSLFHPPHRKAGWIFILLTPPPLASFFFFPLPFYFSGAHHFFLMAAALCYCPCPVFTFGVFLPETSMAYYPLPGNVLVALVFFVGFCFSVYFLFPSPSRGTARLVLAQPPRMGLCSGQYLASSILPVPLWPVRVRFFFGHFCLRVSAHASFQESPWFSLS